MDLGLSDNKVASFKMFQQLVIDQYDKMVDEFGFTVVDGSNSVETQQKLVRAAVDKMLAGWEGLPVHRKSKPSSKSPISAAGGHND
jgi:dTMP kinase